MNKSVKLILLILAGLAPLGLACGVYAADVKVLSQAIETSTDVTPLPTRVPSTLVARACQSCKELFLSVTKSTVFEAQSRKQVTLDQLRAACGNQTTGFLISFDAKSKEVKRIWAECPLSQFSPVTAK